MMIRVILGAGGDGADLDYTWGDGHGDLHGGGHGDGRMFDDECNAYTDYGYGDDHGDEDGDGGMGGW